MSSWCLFCGYWYFLMLLAVVLTAFAWLKQHQPNNTFLLWWFLILQGDSGGVQENLKHSIIRSLWWSVKYGRTTVTYIIRSWLISRNNAHNHCINLVLNEGEACSGMVISVITVLKPKWQQHVVDNYIVILYLFNFPSVRITLCWCGRPVLSKK